MHKFLRYFTAIAMAILTACSPKGADRQDSITSVDTIAVTESTRQLPASVTIAFVGDIMMGTTFPDSIHGSHLPTEGGKHLFDDVKDIISSADFAGGNLEGSFLEGPGKRRPVTNPNTYFIFRMPPTYVQNLLDAGFDFMGIANNHINDFGEPGRQSTMATMRNAGLPFAGLKNHCESVVVERNGVRFGIAQVGHGDNNVDVNNIDEIKRVVSDLRSKSDIVILSFHGGAEGTSYAHVPKAPETYVGEKRGNVVEVAHAAIDAGADAVFGHGPHVVRAAELYNGHIIFYSLGNFCTPYRMSIAGLCGQAPVAVVELDMNGKLLGGQIHSFIQQRGKGPVKDSTNSAARRIATLSTEDFPTSPLAINPDGSLHPSQSPF